MMVEVIRSISNPRVQRLRELVHSARARAQSGLCVLEGVHLATAWLEHAGASSLECYLPVRAQSQPEIVLLLSSWDLAPLWLDDTVFDRISSLEFSSGPLLVAPIPRPELPERIDHDALYLEGVQDPGNLGTILRSAAAFGIERVLTSPGSAACWSPKVLRAGMGAHWLLKLHESVGAAALFDRLGRAVPTGTRARDGVDIARADLRQPRLWLLGSEGQGLSQAIQAHPAVQWVSIEHAPGQESLNVAIAASICLYEQSRQRRASHAQ